MLSSALDSRRGGRVLLFPSGLGSLGRSLSIFVSAFDVSGIFFSRARISKIYLSNRLISNGSGGYAFSSILISRVLPRVRGSRIVRIGGQEVGVSFESIVIVATLYFVKCDTCYSCRVCSIERNSIRVDPTFLARRVLGCRSGIESGVLCLPFGPTLGSGCLFFERSLCGDDEFRAHPIS